MVTPEAHPFAKTGGLAEVTAALPAALARLGHSVTLVLPRYRGVAHGVAVSRTIDMSMGPRTLHVGFVEQTTADGVRAVLVDIPQLFDREGLYGFDGHDFSDNAVRFGALSRAALEYARLAGERPDVIHAHDWQTGLVPVYQKMHLAADPVVGGVPVVFTIHNLAFQGTFGPDSLGSLGLGWDVFNHQALEHWGNISLLKGGVNFSEKISTVSPTYAREILTPEFGFGFEGVLRRRAEDLVGILNGIDTERWNPASDVFVPAAYDSSNLAGKQDAKAALLRTVNLPTDDAARRRPVIGLISRLTYQKGFDLIGGAADALMSLDATWVMLGSGERQYEDLWRALAVRHPDRVSTTIGFDERLAHMIEAGADMFLMPSRFEPCGLNQMYSLRYGTVPIVRATGGLEDTVIDAAEPQGNGIKFEDASPGAVVAAVRRALGLMADRPRWEALQRAGMAADLSWDLSAREYVKVYRRLRG
jgi:starch synthase